MIINKTLTLKLSINYCQFPPDRKFSNFWNFFKTSAKTHNPHEQPEIRRKSEYLHSRYTLMCHITDVTFDTGK